MPMISKSVRTMTKAPTTKALISASAGRSSPRNVRSTPPPRPGTVLFGRAVSTGVASGASGGEAGTGSRGSSDIGLARGNGGRGHLGSLVGLGLLGMGTTHEQAQPLHGRLLGSKDVDDRALEHHGDPVAERGDLLELGRDDEHGRALVALLDDAVVDVLDRADVDAPRRLRRHDQLEGPRELTRGDD